jgi:hypothetical protein
MDQTTERFAHRCLPLLIANQAGWHILNTHTIEAQWNGGKSLDSIQIKILSGAGECPVMSHFGHGLLTWTIPFLFRTPSGYNLWVRGPANWPKDGICALEGLVETDWSPATFTMNWQFTRPDHTVRFEEGEPICCILPQRRGELEQFDPLVEEIDGVPQEAERYKRWNKSRDVFIDLQKSSMFAGGKSWQKHYFNGQSPGEQAFEAHQTKLNLRPFRVLSEKKP